MNRDVLIVDDEIAVLNGLKRAMHNVCPIDIAQGAEAALKKVNAGKRYAVIITDLMMPGMNGLELLKELELIDPHSIKVMLTSSDSQQITIDAINQGKIYKFLRKPCDNRLLLEVINSALLQFHKYSQIEDKMALKEGEVKELTSRLHFQYFHDVLTGLSNRSTFITQLSDILTTKDKLEYSLCYIDIDFFHLINDAVGNTGGDELLRQISHLLSSSIPRGNLLARFNGDIFCLLLKKDKQNTLEYIVNKIHLIINQHVFKWNDKTMSVSASFGVIPIEAQYLDAHLSLHYAENACQIAKQDGRQQVHFGSSQDKQLSEKLNEIHWVNKLNESVNNGFLCLYQQSIQPVVADKTQGLHYEVLLRLIDDNDKVILPSEFLTAAEHYQMSPKVDKWVVQHYAKWLAEHPEHMSSLSMASINLSGHSINDKSMIDFIDQVFTDFAIPKHKICLEITETAAIGGFAGAIEFMNRLKSKGFKFALDDFGTGLSSYAYLKSLPVDILKIDGVFIRNIHLDPIDRAMAQSICDVGHTMGLKIVAEFVENQQIMAILKSMGVDFAQGFYLAKPQPLSMF
jgi:diguanylate cyclase (GGDEF)-like protein